MCLVYEIIIIIYFKIYICAKNPEVSVIACILYNLVSKPWAYIQPVGLGDVHVLVHWKIVQGTHLCGRAYFPGYAVSQASACHIGHSGMQYRVLPVN